MPTRIKPTGGTSQKPRNDGAALRRAIERWKLHAAGPEYAAQANKVRNAAGHIPKAQLLEMFEDMEQRYPGRGWHQQALELSRHYYTKAKFDAEDYLERIWRMQDEAGMKTINNPEWYEKRKAAWVSDQDQAEIDELVDNVPF